MLGASQKVYQKMGEMPTYLVYKTRFGGEDNGR